LLDIVVYYTILLDAVVYYTALLDTVVYLYRVTRYSSILYYVAGYSSMLHRVIRYGSMLYCVIRCGSILYRVIRCGSMPYLSRYYMLHVIVRRLRIWPPNTTKYYKNASKFFPNVGVRRGRIFTRLFVYIYLFINIRSLMLSITEPYRKYYNRFC
jgi:hypothetical protein